MRAFAEAACWFVAAMLVWAATVSTITVTETVVAACTAAAVSVVAVLARRAMGLRFRPVRGGTRWLLLAPVTASADTGRLIAWLAKRRPEPTESAALVRRRVPSGDGPTAVGHRATATVAVSATPGSVVVDADDKGSFLLHRLVGGPPDLDERVSS